MRLTRKRSKVRENKDCTHYLYQNNLVISQKSNALFKDDSLRIPRISSKRTHETLPGKSKASRQGHTRRSPPEQLRRHTLQEICEPLWKRSASPHRFLQRHVAASAVHCLCLADKHASLQKQAEKSKAPRRCGLRVRYLDSGISWSSFFISCVLFTSQAPRLESGTPAALCCAVVRPIKSHDAYCLAESNEYYSLELCYNLVCF